MPRGRSTSRTSGTSTESEADQAAPLKERRARDRGATEGALLDATRQLLQRDGVLAGLNLREVADLAKVNRGQIYQYFGSRQELLRAALGEMAIRRRASFDKDHPQSFGDWRRRVMKQSGGRRLEIRLAALLALDGDTNLRLFPAKDAAVAAAHASKDRGEIASDVDPTGALVTTAATYLGYAVFRDALAEEFGQSVDDLDDVVVETFTAMLRGLERE